MAETKVKTKGGELEQDIQNQVKGMSPEQLQRLGFRSAEDLLGKLRGFRTRLQELKGKSRIRLNIRLILRDRTAALIALSKKDPYEDKAGVSATSTFRSKAARDAVRDAWNEKFSESGLKLADAQVKTAFRVPSKKFFGYQLQAPLAFKIKDEFWSGSLSDVSKQERESLERTLRASNTRLAGLPGKKREEPLHGNSAKRFILNMEAAVNDPNLRTSYLVSTSERRAKVYAEEFGKWAAVNRPDLSVRAVGRAIVFERKIGWGPDEEKSISQTRRSKYEQLIRQISSSLIAAEVKKGDRSQKIGGGVGARAAEEIIAKLEEARKSGSAVSFRVNPAASAICKREIEKWLKENYPGTRIAVSTDNKGKIGLRRAAA
jgi:hypothetical protein